MWEKAIDFIELEILILQSNPENTVGVLTMAGKGVRVLVTPTSDLGKILACMHGSFLNLLKAYILILLKLHYRVKRC